MILIAHILELVKNINNAGNSNNQILFSSMILDHEFISKKETRLQRWIESLEPIILIILKINAFENYIYQYRSSTYRWSSPFYGPKRIYVQMKILLLFLGSERLITFVANVINWSFIEAYEAYVLVKILKKIPCSQAIIYTCRK